jgi:hypothetical protein
VIWLVGVPVKSEDARSLIAMLLADSGSDAMDAAKVIAGAVRVERGIVALTVEQRTAILGVLDDPRPGLAELREVLVADVLAGDETSDV